MWCWRSGKGLRNGNGDQLLYQMFFHLFLLLRLVGFGGEKSFNNIQAINLLCHVFCCFLLGFCHVLELLLQLKNLIIVHL
jgi:hypothetical protein